MNHLPRSSNPYSQLTVRISTGVGGIGERDVEPAAETSLLADGAGS